MGQAHRVQRFTVVEYLASERGADVRHEYIDGEVFAMAGASRAHAMIVANLLATLHSHLRATPCRVLASDIKVRIETQTLNRFYYPDLVVSCSDIETEPDAYYETEPRLIAEVLSASTAATDRREKRLAYQCLDSLQEYMLVAQDSQHIEVYQRQADGWNYATYSAGEDIVLQSIDLAVSLATVYEGVL